MTTLNVDRAQIAVLSEPLLGAPTMVRRVILVGTDLSEAADEAVRQGFRASVERKQRLVVCHVVANPARMNLLFPQVDAPVLDAVGEKRRVLSALDARISELTGAPSGSFDVVLQEGVAEEVLVQLSEKLDAELLVVGGKNESLVGRLFGTTAERLVRHAQAPVLVARATANRGRVLVATDFSDSSFPTIEMAVAEAALRRAELHIVHCVHVPVPPMGMPFMPGAVAPAVDLMPVLGDEMHSTADARLEAALARFSVRGVRHVLEGSAGPEILVLAEELAPELLVVGTVGNTGLRRLVLGSVAEYIVGHAKLPTLVVRLHPDPAQP